MPSRPAIDTPKAARASSAVDDDEIGLRAIANSGSSRSASG
ncbi:MAG: hypothetical protein ACLTXI_09295 [Collinsella sp.]